MVSKGVGIVCHSIHLFIVATAAAKKGKTPVKKEEATAAVSLYLFAINHMYLINKLP